MFLTLPDVGDMIASTSAYTGDLFTGILPLALAGLGLVLAGVFVAFLVRKIRSAIRTGMGGKARAARKYRK